MNIKKLLPAMLTGVGACSSVEGVVYIIRGNQLSSRFFSLFSFPPALSPSSGSITLSHTLAHTHHIENLCQP